MHQVYQKSTTTHAPNSCQPGRTGQQSDLSRNTDYEEDLVEAVRLVLSATGHAALRDIQVEIERGVVVLWGQVPSYHQKQLAQAKAQQIDGVRGIANGIEVVCCR